MDTNGWVYPLSAISPHQSLESWALSQTLSSSSSSSTGAVASEEASFWAVAKVAVITSSSVATVGSRPGIGGNPAGERHWERVQGALRMHQAALGPVGVFLGMAGMGGSPRVEADV